MGSGSSRPTEGGLIPDQEAEPQHPVQSQAAADSTMSERSGKTDFNHFMDATNTMIRHAKEKFDDYEDLFRRHCELKKMNDQASAENESLRQR